MLNVPQTEGWSQTSAEEPAPFQWVPHLLGFLRRRWLTIGAVAAVPPALALAYVLTAKPLFTATAQLLVDTEQATPFQNRSVVAESQAENALVESQVEVLRSEGLARAVVTRLDLANHPAFAPQPGGGPLSSLRGLLGGGGSPEPEADSRDAVVVEGLMRSTRIRRIGLSYAIEINITSPEAALSARLANEMIDAYFNQQFEARTATSRRAGEWLGGRIRELRDQAIAADRAVQEYRASNNIIGTDRGLINEQQLSELSTQLTTARARAGDALARLERLESITADRIAEGSVGEALGNAVIVRLRQQYLDAARREAEFASRYGTNHTAAVNLRAEMAELQRSISSELNRIRESYRSDYEVARANVTALERQLAETVTRSAETNESRVMLRALEGAAETYRSIYSNFLQRYTQVVQDQSFPIADARVITPAEPPRRKSHPRSVIVVAGALVFGLGLGFGAALLREALQRGFRTPAQLAAAIGVPVLGAVPRIGLGLRRALRRRGRDEMLRQVLVDPGGATAEAMWAVKLRADRWASKSERGAAVIGCVAALPGEGATTTAANLARFLASAGHSVVLADLDLRGARLTRALAGGAGEARAGASGPTHRDPETGLNFLPAPGIAPGRPPAAAIDLARQRIEAARGEADYVVLDLPPLSRHLDASALAEVVDAYLLVVRAGRTNKAAISAALGRLEMVHAEVLGAVLNRAG
jgi:succinoglycan biosynthesis transport protein ExoP